MQITDLGTTDALNAQIDFNARGRSNKDITRSILTEWRGSQTILDMSAADEYYRVRNIAIQDKSRDYTDADGAKHENKTLSNAKIAAAFVRSNVQQKVNYAVARPFQISVDGPDPDKDDALRDLYLEAWTDFVTPELRKTVRRIVTDAVNKGIGWAFVTIIDGQLRLFDMEPNQIYPAWSDKAHTALDAVVRDYSVVAYINNERQLLRKVEFWGRDVVERYVDEFGDLRPDNDEVSIDAHMRLGDTGLFLERVPFIALKGNEDELPTLNIIRQQADAYDALQSKAVDGLQDDIDAVLKLVNVSPEMGDLSRARQIMQNSRVVSVDAEGDADYIRNTPDITAMAQMLDVLKKDIREFGQSVDTQDIRWGSNPSGVALKSMYQDLDIYTNGLESEFEVFFQNLKFFFDIWLQFKGVGTVEQWSKYTLTVTLDRDMMVNSAADIQETVMLGSTGVSQTTQDLWNPAVESPEIEQERREREADAAQARGDADMYPVTPRAAEGDDDADNESS